MSASRREFDVYVGRSAADAVVRQVSFQTAHVVARQRADQSGQPVYIRCRKTCAIDTVWPAPSGPPCASPLVAPATGR